MRTREMAPIILSEWTRIGPAEYPELGRVQLDLPVKRSLASLRGRIDIRPGFDGLEIESTSFVGRIDVGSLRVAIQPKLPAVPLTKLLRYAYGLRDIGTIGETSTPTVYDGLHDLLISMLADEVDELLHRGLARHYIAISADLGSPRGKILVEQFAQRGGAIEARLPCRYFERRVNWQLNQVLRAGLRTATWMTDDRSLRRRVHALADRLDDIQDIDRLTTDDIDRAERALTRLTSASAPALTLIRLLTEMQGVAFEPNKPTSRTPGFLFDMNRFFQRLLSRFLRENLVLEQIKDESAIGSLFAYSADANPKRRSSPRPRPDYALVRGTKVEAFLDAKYRDIWEKGYPSDWLYQLAIYALASPSQVSVMLYATMSAGAQDECIEIRQPLTWSNKGPAVVILRPVLLQKLVECVSPDRKHAAPFQRRQFAIDLVRLDINKPAQP
jgi:5-methylcytosine-specific restriction enzyme subunit McrC